MGDRIVVAGVNEGGRELDDDFRSKEVIISPLRETKKLTKDHPDPFEQSGDELKKIVGLTDATKRKISRNTSISKSYTGSSNAKSTKTEIPMLTGYNIFGVMSPPYNMDYLAQLYTMSSPHYAAVNVKVANIVGLGFDWIESLKVKEIIEAIDAPAKLDKVNKKLRKAKQDITDWIDTCNAEDEFLETLKKVYVDYESTGNGYFEIGRTKGGEIGYIGHIPSTTMRVRRQRDGYVQVISSKVVFFRHLGTKTVDPITGDTNPNEVIHIKKYSPINAWYGVPDIISAMQAVAGNEFAARFNLDYFENKAVPRYVIVVKGATLSLTSENRIVEFFELSLKGQHHRTLFVPLPADDADKKSSFEMKPVEAGTQDASFINYNKINLQNIFMAHRTPMSKVSLADGVSLAAARDADRTFKESVCRPEQKILEKKLGKVFKEKTDMFVFKLNELTLTDEDTQSKIDERYLRMQVLVPNEVRARAGMSGLKGGDKVVELKPQQAADATANATGNRQRTQDRTANSTDSASSTTSRSPKGEGRKTP